MTTVLAIGNKAYSSWSLRPWLFMKVNGIAFEEVRIPLYLESSKARIFEHSPAGKVPALTVDDIRVWDSLAILETLADLHPRLACWPRDRRARAWARSISAEMHSGFRELRTALPFNCRRRITLELPSDTLNAEIDRVRSIWRDCRKSHRGAGPFLFGEFTIADAMYAPVVSRFETYGVTVAATEREYMDAILALPAMRQWVAEANVEPEVIAHFERGA